MRLGGEIMKTKEKASRRGRRNKHLNYITLYKRFGKENVFEMEERLERKYPIVFGKAHISTRISILKKVLEANKNGESFKYSKYLI